MEENVAKIIKNEIYCIICEDNKKMELIDIDEENESLLYECKTCGTQAVICFCDNEGNILKR